MPDPLLRTHNQLLRMIMRNCLHPLSSSLRIADVDLLNRQGRQ